MGKDVYKNSSQLSELRGGHQVGGKSAQSFVNRAERLKAQGMEEQAAWDQAHQDTYGPTAKISIPDCWGPWPGSRHDRNTNG